MGSTASKQLTRNAMTNGPGRICCNNLYNKPEGEGAEVPEVAEGDQPENGAAEAGEKDPAEPVEESFEPKRKSAISDEKLRRSCSAVRSAEVLSSVRSAEVLSPYPYPYRPSTEVDTLPKPVLTVVSATIDESSSDNNRRPWNWEGGVMKAKQSRSPSTEPRILGNALTESPMTSKDVKVLSGLWKKIQPFPVDAIVEEHMRMQASHVTASAMLINEKSSKKRVEALILAYEVLDSFGEKYHMTAFKDFRLPEMEQWAFFMFMIGQSAKKKNHPLETYLDVMEATLNICRKKMKKKGAVETTAAFRRMEGAYLNWAKRGYEWNSDLIGSLSVTAFPDINKNRPATGHFVEKLRESTPSGSGGSCRTKVTETTKATRSSGGTKWTVVTSDGDRNFEDDDDERDGTPASRGTKKNDRKGDVVDAGGDATTSLSLGRKSRGSRNESWKTDGVTIINVPRPNAIDGEGETKLKNVEPSESKAKKTSPPPPPPPPPPPTTKKRFGWGKRKNRKGAVKAGKEENESK